MHFLAPWMFILIFLYNMLELCLLYQGWNYTSNRHWPGCRCCRTWSWKWKVRTIYFYFNEPKLKPLIWIHVSLQEHVHVHYCSLLQVHVASLQCSDNQHHYMHVLYFYFDHVNYMCTDKTLELCILLVSGLQWVSFTVVWRFKKWKTTYTSQASWH